jgi:hypothetical protein
VQAELKEMVERRFPDGVELSDSFDDSALSMPLQIDRGDPEVAVSELALDDDQRHALTGHLDRVGVAQLMRSEAPADASSSSGAPQLGPGPGFVDAKPGSPQHDDQPA